MPESKKFRVEKDSMGELQVPSDCLWGASTQRACENFPVSDLRLQRSFIRALCMLKHCASKVNKKEGRVEGRIADAIMEASREAAGGAYDDQFVVDVFQTGSGTSSNMNANEVIANLAIEKLGGKRGDRSLVHPNDHVNLCMSSNDVIPTAIHVASLLEIKEGLVPATVKLKNSFDRKAHEFMDVVKTGRTHLQDATPVRLGQEFSGYMGQMERALERTEYAKERLKQVAFGGTAVGTGLNAGENFASEVLLTLEKELGIEVIETSNHFQAQSTIDEIVAASSVMRGIAVSLMKIANDIRWMSSGPRAGLAEIILPEVQPGSSIMPGKVNPVIAESVCMVAAQVIGNDATVAVAGQSGNFELNVMLPVAGFNLLQSIGLLANSMANFSEKCIDGIEASGRGPELVASGLALSTALVPETGYDLAASISHEAYETGKTIFDVALKRLDLSEEELRKILDPGRMT